MARKTEIKTPWAKIYLAVKAGRGLRLTAAEIQEFRHDDAIMTRGRGDVTGREENGDHNEFCKCSECRPKTKPEEKMDGATMIAEIMGMPDE